MPLRPRSQVVLSLSDDPRDSRHEKIVEVELELAAGTPLRSGMTVDVYFPNTGPSAVCEPDDDAPAS